MDFPKEQFAKLLFLYIQARTGAILRPHFSLERKNPLLQIKLI